jgi:hypothetical protein
MQPIPEQVLGAIEKNLHSVIRGDHRVAERIDKFSVPLPSLAAMVAGEATDRFRPAYDSSEPSQCSREVWIFLVPEMYGGFRLRWLVAGFAAKLEVVSFCRIVSGYGKRYEVTAEGRELVESGMG